MPLSDYLRRGCGRGNSTVTMNYTLAGVGLFFAVLLRALYRRYTRISIRHVPGPRSTSFLLGKSCSSLPSCFLRPSDDCHSPRKSTRNLPETCSRSITPHLARAQPSFTLRQIDFEWQAKYGDVVRYKAAFGVIDHHLGLVTPSIC